MAIDRSSQNWPDTEEISIETGIRITVQVLNGATGEIREVVARVKAVSDQDAVNKLMAIGRKDDYYYRFLSDDAVTPPSDPRYPSVTYNGLVYWANEVSEVQQ